MATLRHRWRRWRARYRYGTPRSEVIQTAAVAVLAVAVALVLVVLALRRG